MSHLVDLAVLGPDQIAKVGGKSVNLGVMIAAGLPVLPGFCITTEAYRTVVGDALDDLVDRLAQTPDIAELAAIARSGCWPGAAVRAAARHRGRLPKAR